jgi:ribosomal protein S18 acetylase RimI-like enzyme|mmetsp:Transcript_17/g.79  ORF Transcript_17/g.79 Transcript_17/m.79 type:complete len:261 (-) Transcript_17:20-802(-)
MSMATTTRSPCIIHTPCRTPQRPGCRASSSSSSSSRPRASLEFTLEVTEDAADIRAAAACRALAFANYPSDRSTFAIRSAIAMKIDAESAALGRKIHGGSPAEGGEVGHDDIEVVCIVARAPCVGELPVGFDLRALDPQCLSVRECGSSIVVGSLDVNVGANLPSEELLGTLSAGRRAYLSNVSVLDPARRQGVARALIERAMQLGAELGLETMYVHVKVSNVAAQNLYSSAGFEIESRENRSVETTLGREPRLLLRRRV